MAERIIKEVEGANRELEKIQIGHSGRYQWKAGIYGPYACLVVAEIFEKACEYRAKFIEGIRELSYGGLSEVNEGIKNLNLLPDFKKLLGAEIQVEYFIRNHR